MNTYVDKSQKPESKSAVTPKKQKNGLVTFQLMDNRSEAVTQRKLQKMANESNQVSQLRSVQEKAHQSSSEEKIPIQKKPNNTGLPDNLKTGIENLSGYSMDDVKVHYNSAKPAQLNAHAYAQGTNIHLASGQEKHLPHEAWHVVQQKQGKVKPTMQLKGKVNINDDKGLEKEADVMGAKAIQFSAINNKLKNIEVDSSQSQLKSQLNIIQRAVTFGSDFEFNHLTSELNEDYAAAKYRSRKTPNTIIKRTDLDTKSKAIVDETNPKDGTYNFKSTPSITVMYANVLSTQPKKIQISEYKKPDIRGFKYKSNSYKITHLSNSGTFQKNIGTKDLVLPDPKEVAAENSLKIKITINGKDNKQKLERQTKIKEALKSDTITKDEGEITTNHKTIVNINFTSKGQAYDVYKRLGIIFGSVGEFKITCELGDNVKTKIY